MKADIIQVEAISKMYRLGSIGTGSLSHDFNRWVSKVRGKADPYEKLAETNDRQASGKSEYVWSLKDISFTVGEQEVFGIIGKNGAGKSTLLKLLSKITRPTSGIIRTDGRIASLLEVGTGFHPELSGRENVYLNGAILGMRKEEIRRKFDEIVDFAGVQRYIDTPVKRYSSGMYVRLAFAVAAHLEPEILIIDEVLAVGDAEFQQKCLGKMKDVSRNHGRTILFVSHNIAAIKQLCDRAMLLEQGQVKVVGKVSEVLEVYQAGESDLQMGERGNIPVSGAGYFTDWKIEGQVTENQHSCYTREQCEMVFGFRAETELTNCEIHLMIRFDEGQVLLHACNMDFNGYQFTLAPGIHNLRFRVDLPVRQGSYDVEVGLFSMNKKIDSWHSSTRLRVLEDFEGHSRGSQSGILNSRTAFVAERRHAAQFIGM